MDAIHISLDSVNNLDTIISLNFKHIVRKKKNYFLNIQII
jgi:hypothetical protein